MRPEPTTRPRWIDLRDHHVWLEGQTDALLRFHARESIDVQGGGFWWVDDDGAPMRDKGKQLWITARHTYGFAIGSLLGRPGSVDLVRRGINELRSGALRDENADGWFWAVDAEGALVDDSKQAYGHAFVVIAACAAVLAGVEAEDVLDDALAVLDRHFWSAEDRMFVDAWNRDFSTLEDYRGQNANMHLVEAMMLAAEVTGRTDLVERAVSIAERLIRDVTSANDGLLPEHFSRDWTLDRDYNTGDRNNLFRPYGSVIGHWLEWSRLLIQLDAATAGRHEWMVDSARALFDRSTTLGWEEARPGIPYSTDWAGVVINTDRYHWVVAEGIGAAVALYRATGDDAYARWYERFWEYAATHLIDSRNGGWIHQLDGDDRPVASAWQGRPDLYHALQATLFSRLSLSTSMVTELARR